MHALTVAVAVGKGGVVGMTHRSRIHYYRSPETQQEWRT